MQPRQDELAVQWASEQHTFVRSFRSLNWRLSGCSRFTLLLVINLWFISEFHSWCRNTDFSMTSIFQIVLFCFEEFGQLGPQGRYQASHAVIVAIASLDPASRTHLDKLQTWAVEQMRMGKRSGYVCKLKPGLYSRVKCGSDFQ